MYGYIRTHASELKVREQEYYRAVYCGLCRTMGKCTGQLSRTTLSYDFTFFALVRMALTGERPTVRPRRCLAHPTRRHLMAEPNEALRLAANLSAVLGYHKLCDDLSDERGLKRTAATLARPYLSSLRRRARKKGLDGADDRVAAAMRALSRLEASRPPSVDTPAELFGELMAALLSHGLSDDRARLAHVAGRHIGRWIYIIDAADDYEDDVRRGRYNPFICLYTAAGHPPVPTLSPDKREEIRIALLGELAGLESAFDLLEITDDPDLGGILRNVLYLGLPREAERILCGNGSCDPSPAEPPKKASRRKKKAPR